MHYIYKSIGLYILCWSLLFILILFNFLCIQTQVNIVKVFLLAFPVIVILSQRKTSEFFVLPLMVSSTTIMRVKIYKIQKEKKNL